MLKRKAEVVDAKVTHTALDVKALAYQTGLDRKSNRTQWCLVLHASPPCNYHLGEVGSVAEPVKICQEQVLFPRSTIVHKHYSIHYYTITAGPDFVMAGAPSLAVLDFFARRIGAVITSLDFTPGLSSAVMKKNGEARVEIPEFPAPDRPRVHSGEPPHGGRLLYVKPPPVEWSHGIVEDLRSEE